MSQTTHTTTLASTFPNWYFILLCFPLNAQTLILSQGSYPHPLPRGSFCAALSSDYWLASRKFNCDRAREILESRYETVIEILAGC
jgi:hypothetical protein